MLKKYLLPILAAMPGIIASKTLAFCPICTAAVLGGVGLSRWLKIDDTIAGLWIGGLIVATSGWTINWVEKRKLNFYGRNFFITLAYYAIVIIPLFYYKIVGHPANQIWGMDKLLFGTAVGSVLFYAAHLQYEIIKKQNKGHAQFPFQRIVMPVGTLLILSGIFYLVTRY